MKKITVIILSAVMGLSICACGGAKSAETATAEITEVETTTEAETTITKEELLEQSEPFTLEDFEKSYSNLAFANSLVGNVYTFYGMITSIEKDYAVAELYNRDNEGVNVVASGTVLELHLYLPLDDLISMEVSREYSFVGKLQDATKVDSINGPNTCTAMIFDNVAVVSDRIVSTGILNSQNESYGSNAWNIEYPHSSHPEYLGLVYFAEDVSAYKRKEITFSYIHNNKGSIDARIVE